jgi:cytochrome c oxidase assembly factor CtaG
MRLSSVKALLIAAAAAGLVCLDARPAAAHAGEPLAPHDLWTTWEFTPHIVLMLLMLGAVYWSAVSNLWRSAGAGRLIAPWRAGAYLAGVAILAVALVSPIDALGGVLFSAHMVQHMLLMMAAAPLLALGAPAYIWLWALPVGLRRTLARWWIGRRFLRRTVHLLGLPLVIWLVSTLALWLWHVPQLYEAALSHDLVHALEHVSFLWTAWLFWGLVFELCSHSKMGDGMAILLLFTAAMQSGILGALITFARLPWYTSYQGTTAAWGLSALADQQLAGVIMWVPAGTVYLAATLAILGIRLASLDRQAASPVPRPRALPPLLVLLLLGVSMLISGCSPSALGTSLGMNEVSILYTLQR